MTNPDRRNDVGAKVTISVLSSVLVLVLSLFVHAAWNVGEAARTIGLRNTERIVRVEACFEAVHADLREIKELLKRRVN